MVSDGGKAEFLARGFGWWKGGIPRSWFRMVEWRNSSLVVSDGGKAEFLARGIKDERTLALKLSILTTIPKQQNCIGRHISKKHPLRLGGVDSLSQNQKIADVVVFMKQ